MRLCTKCNKMLKDSDKYCPYCTGQNPSSVIAPYSETSSSASKSAHTDSNVSTIAPPAPPSDAEHFPAAEETSPATDMQALFGEDVADEPDSIGPKDKAEIPPSSDTEFHELTAEFPFQTQSAYEDENAGMIEREIEQTSYSRNDKSLNKIGATLIVVIILAILGFGVALLCQLFEAPDTPGEDFYFEYLTGTWVSDEFYLGDNEERTYVEILTVNEDHTFRLQWLVVNKSIPNGYTDGSWDVYQDVSGKVLVNVNSKSFSLIFEVDGQEVADTRVFSSLEDDSMILRIYYEEELEFFEMKLKRIEIENEEG